MRRTTGEPDSANSGVNQRPIAGSTIGAIPSARTVAARSSHISRGGR